VLGLVPLALHREDAPRDNDATVAERARVRGRARVTHDFALFGAAQNLRRLASLGVHHDGSTWTR